MNGSGKNDSGVKDAGAHGSGANGSGTSGAGVDTIDADTAVAPAEVARWVLGQLFHGGEGELRRIAADLAALGTRMDGLGREINATLGRLNWHGTASDAFVQHARSRVRAAYGLADDLSGASRSVQHLVDVH